jgi:Fic family protein
MPGARRLAPLLGKAHELTRAALGLAGTRVPVELKGLLRAMNSYYSNRIEGQHTRPRELAQALARDFSQDAALARRQRLAVAHIEAEQALEAAYPGTPGQQALFRPPAVAAIHTALFERLPEPERQSDQGEPIIPGQWRAREVAVGRHVAPTAASVPALLDRWAQAYGELPRGDVALVGVFAAHHRLGWVHPFIDGNGRVMRLHTHAWLSAGGYTGGLWSPLRGFARQRDRYFALLEAADSPRRGDLDGRGNLSEQALVDWIDFSLDLCLDQVSFMQGLLRFDQIEQRIAACLHFEAHSVREGVRAEALRPLHYLFVTGGELERGEFKRMTGLGDRNAVSLLSALVKRGLLVSDTVQGKVRFGLPHHALRFYFPALWPEAEADA